MRPSTQPYLLGLEARGLVWQCCRMKRRLLLITGLILAGAYGQQFRTAGLQNGNTWREWTESAKLAYIDGFSEGHCPDISAADCRNEFPVTLKFGEVCTSLDLFYAEAKNRPVPISWALGILATKTTYGVGWGAMEGMTQSLRQLAAKYPSAK
jgi:hypothetical protein